MRTNQSFADISRVLVDVAMGRKPADVVIRNGQWVCVQSGEILPHTDIAIIQERIAYVGPDASHTIGKGTEVVDAEGLYLSPGLLDAHAHVESGMLTVTEFVRAVLPWGTTGLFVDPHEIANVFGLKGVRLLVDEAVLQPIHVWVQAPSCIPSAQGFETPGAAFGPEEVAEAMTWPGIIGLGEVMNFPGVFLGDEKMHTEMAITRQAGKVVGGHYASPDLGLPFHGYAAGGPEDDHEGTTREDAVQRIRQGMKVMMRQGSAWHDVVEQVRAITENRLDPRHFMLCTDDSHSATLVAEGNVNRAVKVAISQGVSPVTAYQMATINTAEHFGVSKEVGQIAPGRYADILFISNLPEVKVEKVMARGTIIVEKGQIQIDLPDYEYPGWATDSVNLTKRLSASDFRLALPANDNSPTPEKVTANVIGIIENQAPTRHLRLEVPVHITSDLPQGEVLPNLEEDIAKVALIDRHHGTGRIQVGLVQGFGFSGPCAVASTVAHDCHQLVVIGTNEEDMAAAANALAKLGGGQVVVQAGEIIGQVALPIAGIISNQRAEQVAQQAESVLEGFRQCGCSLNNPNMQLSLIALVVIPELRISDLGLVDANRFEFIPVIENS